MVEHRVSTEGADYLSLAGVNDANLMELAQASGARVILRGDHLILSGDVNNVERALPVAEKMVSQARMGRPFDTEDIHRMFGSGEVARREAANGGSAGSGGSGGGGGAGAKT